MSRSIISLTWNEKLFASEIDIDPKTKAVLDLVDDGIEHVDNCLCEWVYDVLIDLTNYLIDQWLNAQKLMLLIFVIFQKDLEHTLIYSKVDSKATAT